MSARSEPKLSRKARYAARRRERDRRRQMADLAQRYLDRHQPKEYRIEVNPEAVALRGDTWFIVAEPDRVKAPGYDYINRMTEAAMELEEKEKVHVFLVPVIPPEDD
jgi:hypothetical protein